MAFILDGRVSAAPAAAQNPSAATTIVNVSDFMLAKSKTSHAHYNESGNEPRGQSWIDGPARYLISAIRMMMGIGTPSSHNRTERMIAS